MAQANRMKRIGTVLELVGEVRRSPGVTDAAIEISNVGPSALNACEVRCKTDNMETGYTLASNLAQYSDTDLLGCVAPDGSQGDPTTLAPGGTVHLDVPFRVNTVIEIWASVGSGQAIVKLASES